MIRRIKVTAEHIAKGRRGSPWECPIALACKEQITARIEVALNGIRVGDEFVYLGLSHIEKVQRFDADHPRKLEPFEFELDTLA